MSACLTFTAGGYMETAAIQPIISNYKRLSELAHVPAKKNLHTVWGIEYKDKNVSGFANELGTVETKHSLIQINGDELRLDKKPFWLTWEDTLKNMNTLLEKMIKNFNNKNFVTKTFVSIHCFPEKTVDRLTQA